MDVGRQIEREEIRFIFDLARLLVKFLLKREMWDRVLVVRESPMRAVEVRLKKDSKFLMQGKKKIQMDSIWSFS